jgi:hypothetical protein
MELFIEKGNPIQAIGDKYHIDLHRRTRAITLEEYIKSVAAGKIPVGIPTMKYDGSLNLLFWDGKEAKIYGAGEGGKVRTNLMITSLAEAMFKKIGRTLIIGELCGIRPEPPYPMKFSEFQSASCNPSRGDELCFRAVDVLEHDGKSFSAIAYPDRLEFLARILGEDKPDAVISAVRFNRDVNALWDYTIKNKFEGLMVHSSHYVWKIKPAYTLDAVIYAIEKKGERMKYGTKQIGSVRIALVVEVNKQPYLLEIGKVGSGWTDQERKDLYEELIATKIAEDKDRIYVKARHIIEVRFNELNPERVTNAFILNDDGTYVVTPDAQYTQIEGGKIKGLPGTSQYLRHPDRVRYSEKGQSGDYPMISEHRKKVTAHDIGVKQAPTMSWSVKGIKGAE